MNLIACLVQRNWNLSVMGHSLVLTYRGEKTCSQMCIFRWQRIWSGDAYHSETLTTFFPPYFHPSESFQ